MIPVAELMSTGLLTVCPDCSVRVATRVLLDGGVNLVPVTTEAGALVGAVSSSDLLAVEDDSGPVAAAIGDGWCQAAPDERVRALARRMHEAGAHHALVLERGRLIGLVSSMDIVACMLRHSARLLEPAPPLRIRRRRVIQVLAVACNRRRLAEACGERYHVEGVDSLDGHMAALEAGAVDLLVISDKATGYLEEIRRLRRSLGPAELPILAEINVGSPRAVLEAHEAGASDTVGHGASPDEVRVKCGLLMACFKRKELHHLALPGGAEHAFGRYQILDELGSGGYGVVYRAHDCVQRTEVALKVLLPGRCAQREARHRFLREFYALSTVNSPFVVRAVDSGLQEGRAYLSMDHVPGPSLEDVVEEDGPLDEEAVLVVLEGLLEGLAAIVSVGLLHRDLKPSNVILRDGDVQHPVLVDLGLAKRGDDTSVTALNVIVGSPRFLSPERILGKTEDVVSELFSLGLVARYALEGHALYPRLEGLKLLEALARPLPRLRRASPALTQLLERLTAHRPADRCQTAEEALAEVERARETLRQAR